MAEAGEAPKLAILGFKPQKLGDVAPELARLISEETVVVSLLAGVEAATLRGRFMRARSIVRMMPNLPVSIRRGVVARGVDGRVAGGSVGPAPRPLGAGRAVRRGVCLGRAGRGRGQV
jgi:pyrroline-5-carboxylate reductase